MDLACPLTSLDFPVEPMTLTGKDGWRARPQTAEQVAQLLKQAADRQVPMAVSWYEAQKMATPFWLDLSDLCAVRSYRAEDLTLHVETGITASALEKITAQHQQVFPHSYPPDWTVSDILAEECLALEAGLYGYPRDWVLGLEIATPDGLITHSGGQVVKNVAGYDFNKLYVGSYHMLGVMTAVVLKLKAKAAARKSWVFGFDYPEKALNAATRILNEALPLTQCEVYADSGAAAQLYLRMAGEASVLKEAGSVLGGLDLGSVGAQPLKKHEEQTLFERWQASWNAPLIIEMALPDGKVHAALEQMEASPCQPDQIFIRPAASLITMVWIEHLPLPSDLEKALEELSRAAVTWGAVFRILKCLEPYESLVRLYNLPSDRVLRQWMSRIKLSYDPQQILVSRMLPLV